MKLYYSLNKIAPNGYLHIDANPKDNNLIFSGNYYDEIEFQENCTHIIVDNILQLVPYEKYLDLMRYWYGLLSDGSKLTIHTLDFIELCKSVLIAEIQIENLNKLIYSNKSVVELDNLCSMLKSIGFKIINQKLDYSHCLVECIK